MEEAEITRQSERWWSFREKSIEYSKEYGSATVRYLVLINGGSIIAALTFIGNLKKESRFDIDLFWMKFSFSAFFFGLVAALVVGFLGYLNFQHNAQSVPDPNQLESRIRAGLARTSGKIQKTATFALVLGLLSLGCFALGAFLALLSFKVAP